MFIKFCYQLLLEIKEELRKLFCKIVIMDHRQAFGVVVNYKWQRLRR